MRLVCEKATLSNAISIVSRTVSPKSSLPFLEGIYMIADEEGLRLTGYNLETGITVRIDAKIRRGGECVMPTRMFADIVRKLPDDVVTVEVDETFRVVIEAGVAKAMEDYAPKSLNGLEKRLGLMVLIASVSPLIGMCGTVTGMINSFSVMAEAAGLDPGAVAGGISEALITTAAGLIIAIPGVVAYNMFQKRVEDWNLQIEGAITDFIESFA